jgi:hypothetical protein
VSKQFRGMGKVKFMLPTVFKENELNRIVFLDSF